MVKTLAVRFAVNQRDFAMMVPVASHFAAKTCSMDFVADTFGASRRLRILAIHDGACRENLCLVRDTRNSGVQASISILLLHC